MKVIQYKCNLCSNMYNPEFDLIHGYEFQLEDIVLPFRKKINYVTKESSEQHICFDCINAIKEALPPSALN